MSIVQYCWYITDSYNLKKNNPSIKGGNCLPSKLKRFHMHACMQYIHMFTC